MVDESFSRTLVRRELSPQATCITLLKVQQQVGCRRIVQLVTLDAAHKVLFVVAKLHHMVDYLLVNLDLLLGFLPLMERLHYPIESQN